MSGHFLYFYESIADILQITHDNHSNSHGKVDDLMALANRINKTQEDMNQKIDNIADSIGFNSSILPTPSVTSQISESIKITNEHVIFDYS